MTAIRLATFALVALAAVTGCGKSRGTIPATEVVTLPGGAADGSDVTVDGRWCAQCHGDATRAPLAGDAAGVDFAPPVDVARQATGAKVGAHMAHLRAGQFRGAGVPCGSCHVTPATPNAHVQGVIFKGLATTHPSVTAAAAYASGACSNTYCHGNFRGGSGASVAWTGASSSVTCESCHLTPPANAAHSALTPSPGNLAQCAACHSDTMNPNGTLNLASGTHIDGQVEGGESGGGVACGTCHSSIVAGMTGAATSKHALASDDPAFQTAINWADPLSGNAVANRSCTNMCHDDHPHTAGGTTDHSYNVYADANARAPAPSTTTRARTDFDPAAANGGLCISCHRFGVTTGGPTIDKAAFTASAHAVTTLGITWQYALHLGNFARVCTKCHASNAEGTTPTVDATGSNTKAVHFGANASLLAGSTTLTASVTDLVCYNCHGSAAPVDGAQGNRSGKDIRSEFAKSNAHIGAGVDCMSCHDPHQAKAGRHASGTDGNLASGPIQGVSGARASTTATPFWTAPAAGTFTSKSIVAGADFEATLCFKCHSAFAGTLPAGTTDIAMEFNPNNVGNFAGNWASGETAGSFHPVLASAGGNLGATSNIKAPFTRTTLMTCTDCHASDVTTDPAGPHGSAAGFLLKGPNTLWDNTLKASSTGMPANVFCINCHNQDFTGSRFAAGGSDGHVRGNHQLACFNCHAAIPHGGPRPGLLNPGLGGAAGVGGPISGWDATAPYYQGGTTGTRLGIISYPGNNTTNWDSPNCGCNNATSGH